MLKKYQTLIKKLKNTPRFLANNAFIVSLILILFSLILGIFLSYKYNVLVRKGIEQRKDVSIIFNEKELEKVLKIQETRKQRLDQTNFKDYYNPFSLDLD